MSWEDSSALGGWEDSGTLDKEKHDMTDPHPYERLRAYAQEHHDAEAWGWLSDVHVAMAAVEEVWDHGNLAEVVRELLSLLPEEVQPDEPRPDDPSARGRRMIVTITEARAALDAACLDAVADHSEEAVERAWPDLVRYVASQCTDNVAEELLRQEGITR